MRLHPHTLDTYYQVSLRFTLRILQILLYSSFIKTSRSRFYYSFFFLNFTILYWFCHISKWICHRHTCVPHSEPSSLLPPHTIPQGHPSAPASSIQYRASNLDWRLVSYMILYIFQCHSPKSSHPLPLPQRPKWTHNGHSWRGISKNGKYQIPKVYSLQITLSWQKNCIHTS